MFQPPIPTEREATIRQEIITILRSESLSAKDISGRVRIPEKAVFEHLAHIQRSFHGKDFTLKVIPAECRSCGYVFRKRDRLKKPGKCPVCRSEFIEQPLFSIAK